MKATSNISIYIGIAHIVQNVLTMLLRDGGLPPEMDVNTARGVNLTMLVLSLLDCMCNNEAMGDLNPLSELINQPLQAVNHFLPTMVDDQYELMAENIRIALQRDGENPAAYGKMFEIIFIVCLMLSYNEGKLKK